MIWSFEFDVTEDVKPNEQTEIARELEEAIEGQVESIIRHHREVTFGSANVNIVGSHGQWEPGEPCPECGNREVCLANINSEIFYSGEGTFEYVEPDEAFDDPLLVLCEDCGTHLAATLSGKLLDD